MDDWFLKAKFLDIQERLHFKRATQGAYADIRKALDAAYAPKKYNVYGHGDELWIIRYE